MIHIWHFYKDLEGEWITICFLLCLFTRLVVTLLMLQRQPNQTEIDIFIRGAIGAVRTSKLDKTPVKSALHRCRLLFFKIKVRPRSCRSYPIWSPCSYIQILCRFQKCKQKVPSPSLLSSVMKNNPLPQQERFFSASIRVIFHYRGVMVEELFAHIFGIYIKFGYLFGRHGNIAPIFLYDYAIILSTFGLRLKFLNFCLHYKKF